jgi:hypothetical protein
VALKAKKTDADSTYSGVTITTSYVSLSVSNYATLWKNAQFCADLDNGLVSLSDDVREYTGDAAWEMIEDFLEARDASGRKLIRGAATIDGWHYQLLSVEVTTGKYGGFYNKDYSETDLGFVTHKIYDASNAEITSGAGEGAAVRTEVWIRPSHDYEVVGAVFGQATPSSSDVRMWVIGLPGIANIKFATGGINLKHAGDDVYQLVDGRAGKYLQYVPGVVDANSFKIILRHDAGEQHSFQLHFEIFKSP